MIDYNKIADSIDYYTEHGFTRIEAPWTVSKYVDDLTRPSDAVPFELTYNGKRLVASGEQSFLYLYLKDFLPKGQFQTVTPCFRLESFDYTHSKYFIKNELIKTDRVNEIELIKIVELCIGFYSKYVSGLEIVRTDIGYDIYKGDVELGSYGIRTNNFLEYIYATGIAEPRLSRVIDNKL